MTTKQNSANPLEISLKESLLHWKASGVGRKLAKTSEESLQASHHQKKEPFSLYYVFNFWGSPPGLNSSLATYLDLNAKLLLVVAFLAFGNVFMIYQTRVGYCRYLAKEMEGSGCAEKFSLYSYLINFSAIFTSLDDDSGRQNLKSFFGLIVGGMLQFLFTMGVFPFLFM